MAVAAALLLGLTAGPVAADPENANTLTFDANCTGLGEVTAVGVLFPTPNARGGTSAFQVLDRNIVIVLFTTGTNRLAEEADTSCLIHTINGQPVDPFTVWAYIVGEPRMSWDPAQDWLDYPNQANPTPDRYGNPGVWSYMASTSLTHDPSTYYLLPTYREEGERWYVPGLINLFVEHSYPGSPAVALHSYGGRVVSFGYDAILAWTSPVNARVSISGQVETPPLEVCPSGDGLVWSIDQGSENLFEYSIPEGGSVAFDVKTTVTAGETIYFIHDPGWDSDCDLAVTTMQITTP